jgi:hypothetical protein
MGMADDARHLASDRSAEQEARRQRIAAWDQRAIELVTPVITEYAQALVRVGVRPEQMNGWSWFEPNLVLVDRTHQDGEPKARCRFRVHPDGTWSWIDKPHYSDYGEPESLDSLPVRERLTAMLSGAMMCAGQD